MHQIPADRVLSVYRRILEAWNRRNADEFAAAFTLDGNVVGFDGSPLNGQAEIAATLRGIFEKSPDGGVRGQSPRGSPTWPRRRARSIGCRNGAAG